MQQPGQSPSRWSLVWPVLASIVLPLIAAWFVYPDHLPPKFGVFPPEFVAPAPGFNLVIFVLVGIVAAGIVLFVLFPRLFGFAPTVAPPAPAKAKLPIWFWFGLAVTGFFWWLMWARVTPFGDLVFYAFTPLWWGFILMLDGVVYWRNAGRSLLSRKPLTLAISAIISLVGWYYFEYYNYFVLGNWYYPNSTMPQIPHTTMVWIYLLAYTTVWPAVFEWYNLLGTFPHFAARYARGPKLTLPANLLMLVGFVLIVAMVFWPRPFFWAVWIGPLAIITAQLQRLGVWTPFTAISQGNWTPGVLMGLACFFNGFVWEVWNYGSAHPEMPITNPNYWIYDIPYVNVIHLYAEMPLEGYFGYIPFGILTWIFFIWAGKLCGFDVSLDLDD
ncbi:hypothetical protein [Niveibacterium sp. SC-1]|uniref:hypothetical protein n=1 Tax=Niveibacterium sp. SC-1 TaxID=3135646 RepID=UPI00312018F7